MIINYIVMARLLLYAVKFQSPQIQFSVTLSTSKNHRIHLLQLLQCRMILFILAI